MEQYDKQRPPYQERRDYATRLIIRHAIAMRTSVGLEAAVAALKDRHLPSTIIGRVLPETRHPQ